MQYKEIVSHFFVGNISTHVKHSKYQNDGELLGVYMYVMIISQLIKLSNTKI